MIGGRPLRWTGGGKGLMIGGRVRMSSSLPSTPSPFAPGGSAPNSGSGDGRLRICNVATKASTRDEFIAAFTPLVDEESVFVPARIGLELGAVVRFQIALVDGKLAYAGIGEVREIHTPATGPFGRAGVRFFVRELDVACRPAREQMLERRRAKGELRRSP